ncbi:MAG: glycosyltransferase, partial [Clostridia bacterium]
IFLGVKSNPYPYIKECDLFLMSSRYEGYSIVLNEALILEKKILTTNTLGPKEILAGYNNYLICDADIQGIYIGLKFFLDDKI